MERLAEILSHALDTQAVPLESPLIAAVSGGPDSMALLHLLASRRDLRARTIVAHVNHGLRAESAEEARLVESASTRYGLPFRSTRLQLDPPAPGNLADRLRSARYAFLQDVAGETGTILTAHHADDQAVTLLMRLIEGAALPGLQGIPPRTGNVVRPLLEVPHSELRKWLERGGHAYREDASNADETKFRNRVRRRLLPILEEERPGAALRLADVARRLREDDTYLQEQAGSQLEAAQTGPGWVELPLARLPQPAILRRIIARILAARWELPAPAASQWRSIADCLAAGRKANLPGRVTLAWLAEKEGGKLVWVVEDLPDFEYRLDISAPGVYVLPVGRLTVHELEESIKVRPWFPGDRETCDNEGAKEGIKVAKKLSGWVPEHRRRGWPVLISDTRLQAPAAGVATTTPQGRFLFEPLVLTGETGLKEAPNEL